MGARYRGQVLSWTVGVLLAGGVALGGSAANEDPASLSLFAAAMRGEAVREVELENCLLSTSSAERREFASTLASYRAAPDGLFGSLRPDQRHALDRMARAAAVLPTTFAERLVEVDGLDPNASLMITTGLDIAAELGDASDVDAVFLLAGAWPRTGAPRQAAMPARLREVLSRILAGHPEAGAAVRRQYRAAGPEFQRVIVDAFAGDAHPASAVALARCLGVHPEQDGVVLNRLQGSAKRTRAALHEVELSAVRRYLSSPVNFEREQAANCMGALDDPSATQALIEALNDPSPEVARASHAALRSLTAMTMGPDVRRWRAWLAEQEVVWRERRQEFLRILANPQDPRFAVTLNQLGLLRLHRAELAPAITRMIESTREEEPLTLACAAVESLRASDALPAVVGLLEHPSDGVRARAHRTLVVVTGRDLPARAPLWRRALSEL